jgi:hypothetical protein
LAGSLPLGMGSIAHFASGCGRQRLVRHDNSLDIDQL